LTKHVETNRVAYPTIICPAITIRCISHVVAMIAVAGERQQTGRAERMSQSSRGSLQGRHAANIYRHWSGRSGRFGAPTGSQPAFKRQSTGLKQGILPPLKAGRFVPTYWAGETYGRTRPRLPTGSGP